jgi:adenosylcobinamide kinase/adenosylcobinamide-phosphate guanylyltransferase
MNHGAGRRLYFVATAQARDEEMRDRIAQHRKARPSEFITVEEPRDLAAALAKLEGHADIVVIDCLTLWISNQMELCLPDQMLLREADSLAAALKRVSYSSIVVTGEVGAGLVPENPLARRFRDLLGSTNQKIASAADQVLLMVAGYPLRAK